MKVITDSGALAAFCEALSSADYITVDTEFMRESTFWPILCLIQVAGPEDEAIIDPLAAGIDLTPLYDLIANEQVLKVMHAASQDIEIFHHFGGVTPLPLFDTQPLSFSWPGLVRQYRYTGADRQRGADQVTSAVTSRLLGQTDLRVFDSADEENLDAIEDRA